MQAPKKHQKLILSNLQYIALNITGNAEQRDVVTAFITQIENLGIEETEEVSSVFFNNEPHIKQQIDEALLLLDGSLTNLISISGIESKNWNELWEKNFEPMYVEPDIYIHADFHAPNQQAKHNILINPKMAFGTGHHPTTYLMLKQLSALQIGNKQVVDAGTGTGVLAIYTEKLGAKNIFAFDISPAAVDNTIENIQKNFCKSIEVKLGSAADFDLNNIDIYLANIEFNALNTELPIYAKALAPNGLLLLSGYLTENSEKINSKAITCGLKIVNQTHRADWVCGVFAKLA